MGKRILKFYGGRAEYRCPVCKGRMDTNGGFSSIVCENGHCFDLSSKGYINFLQNVRQSKCYDASFFEQRRKFIGYGFYSHIYNEICGIIGRSGQNRESLRIADAGCGEGSLALAVKEKFGRTCEMIAFDFSKDAVRIASRGGNDVLWMVSDISNIPLADNSVDFVTNVYSPANYSEFRRILRENGTLVKVIPGRNHMSELRKAVGAGKGEADGEFYSGEKVADVFRRNFEISERYTVSRTLGVSEEQTRALAGMTPLTFGYEKNKTYDVTEITVEAEILISHT